MIQVINLAGDFSSPSAGEAQKLRKASEEWGCFRIINHGVPPELLADMKALAAHLFDLPVEIKRKNKSIIPHSGYLAPSPTNPNHEALGIFDVRDPRELEAFYSQLQLSTHQRETIEKYSEAIAKVFVEVAGKLAKSVGYHGDNFFEGWIHQVKANHYSGHYSGTAVGLLGVGMHTDSCFITLLQDDEYVGGLEVMDQSGEFVAVDPAPGSLFVNLGDCATIWSNGRMRTVPHQVQCKEARERYTIGSFFSPSRDMVVEAPNEFIDSDHPRLYSPVTYEDLRMIRAKHNFIGGRALDLLRLVN